MADVTPSGIVRERFRAQFLTGTPAATPRAVTQRLLAVQAQDFRAAKLAIRARTKPGSSAADVDRALTRDRSMVVSWFNRGTLHLVAAEDFWWLHALTAPSQLMGNIRRLGQEGVSETDAERGVTLLDRAVQREGPLTRRQLRERLDAAGVPTSGQALVHLLGAASLRGLLVRGPVVGKEQAFVAARDWIGAPPAPRTFDRDAALARLAERYLAGHAPATDRDLARWSGLPLGDARRGMRAIAGRLHDRGDGLVALSRRPASAPIPKPRMLGGFEPLLLGWTSREAIVPEHASTIVTTNGLFRPFAFVDGRAVGIWSLAGGRITLTPFGGALPTAVRSALDADAADVLRYLGEPVPDSKP